MDERPLAEMERRLTEGLATARARNPHHVILRWFAFEHLGGAERRIGREFARMALFMATELTVVAPGAGPETTAGLRKLLEARDCALRASMPAEG